MDMLFLVENIKCEGCATHIRNELGVVRGVQSVRVDIKNGEVLVISEPGMRMQLGELLNHLGYPEKGSVQGVDAVKSKIKSYVSCAIGRINKDQADETKHAE